MREVTTAKSAGFCFGVRRAVDMVYAEAKKDTGYLHSDLSSTMSR